MSMKCKKSIDNSSRYIAMQSELHDGEQWEMRAKVLNSYIASQSGNNFKDKRFFRK